MLATTNNKANTFQIDPLAVTVRDLPGARRTVDAARRLGCAVLLLTEPGAHAWHGPGYLKAMLEQAGAARAVLDCGDDAGAAMLALRLGWRELHMTGPADTVARIVAMTAAAGSRFHAQLPESLDLGALGPVDEPLERWLVAAGSN